MMSLTSSLALPPNDIDTVESGCDAAGAELGLAEKSVMENVACAEPGEASMRKNAASDVATGVRILAIPMPIVLLNDAARSILRDLARG
jgi:hypothetical protein